MEKLRHVFMLGVGAVVIVLLGLLLVTSLALGGAEASMAVPVGPVAVAGMTVAGIPGPYLLAAEESGRRFDVPWSVLAGIYRVECDFGTSRLAGCNPRGTENPMGAQGPGQFLAPTWRRTLAPLQLIPDGPPTRSVAAGFATDGDGDGIADPWDTADAVASTARMLAADGAARDIAGAVYDYNHSWAYVDEVLALAAHYRRAAAAAVAPPSPAAEVVAFARAQLGDPYQWAGAGPDTWDCSGLVMVAYRQVGVELVHNALAQYEATAAARVPLTQLRPGDLVFFGPDLTAIGHVGIFVGDGEMIDAPHTGAVVRVESIYWSDLLVATRPLALRSPGR